MNHTIESRKDQHRRWNQHWEDVTWEPLTPPADVVDPPKWAPLFPDPSGYPSPPPSLPSRGSHDRDGDVEMKDSHATEPDAEAGAEYRFIFSVPPPYPMHTYPGDDGTFAKRFRNPSCRIRHGRGGRLHLEARKHRVRGAISRGVVSDSESDDDVESFHSVSDAKAFDYRCALNSANTRPRSDSGGRPSGDQTASMAGTQPTVTGQAQPAASGNTS